MRQLNINLQYFMLFFVCVILFTGFLWATPDIRGTIDQYWHLSYTSILKNGGAPETNLVFPGMVLRQNVGEPTTFFLHNNPLLSINAWLATYVGDFNAWKVTNILFVGIATFFTAKVVSLFADKEWAIFSAFLYITLPLTIWLSANLVFESFYSAITAVFLYYCCQEKFEFHSWIIVATAMLLGVYSHPMFYVAGIFFIVKIVCLGRYALAIMFLATMLVAYSTTDLLFPSDFHPDLKTIIEGVNPDKGSAMLWFFTDQLPQMDIAYVFGKFIHSIKIQFFTPKFYVFSLLTNISIICFFYLFFTRRKGVMYKKYLAICFVFYGLYGGITVLMQNQFRYQQLIAPIVVSVVIITLACIVRNRKPVRVLFAGVIMLLLCVDLYVFNLFRTQALFQSDLARRSLDYIESVAPEERIAFVGIYGNAYAPIATNLYPRKALLVDTKYLSAKKIRAAIDLFKPRYIVSEYEDVQQYVGIVKKIGRSEFLLGRSSAQVNIFELVNPIQ